MIISETVSVSCRKPAHITRKLPEREESNSISREPLAGVYGKKILPSQQYINVLCFIMKNKILLILLKTKSVSSIQTFILLNFIIFVACI